MGDIEFKGVGEGELRRVSLAGFTELGEAGMDRAGMVCRLRVLGPKVFPAEAMGKGDNISRQEEMIKARFWRKGETFRKDRGFRSNERLGGEVNDRMGGIGISVGRGGLEFFKHIHYI